MNINWNDIRAIDGQREGFEELVCQLASREIIPDQIKFVRIGKPDGGKECYWELKSGALHAWQAKYFTNSLGDSQWTQITKSVRGAIDNHPALEKYYIAIPVDRPDAKSKGKSMLQKWNKKVEEWTVYASSKGMKVSFEYWGKHELELRLAKPESEGLRYFWFNLVEFTDDWIDKKNQESLEALGGRYTPELNFELPIAKIFNGLSRDEEFAEQVHELYDKMMETSRSLYLQTKKQEVEDAHKLLMDALNEFKIKYESLILPGVAPLPVINLTDGLDKFLLKAEALENVYQRLRDEEEQIKRDKGEKIDYYIRPYHNELHHLREFNSATRRFWKFINSVTFQLANRPYLVLTGPAGIGKSHLLADVVEKRKRKGYPSMLLLGENFSTNEMPWTQILYNQLRTRINEHAFLGALNAKAESLQTRIVVFIDALNEGQGRTVWPHRLKAFIRSFETYPWLGLVVSIRDSFEKLIAPEENICKEIASRKLHPGFEELEYEAASHFFKYYGIIPPGSPLLHPEFQNPLFLKLFCDGLAKRSLRTVPPGYEGITSIIEYYLESVEIKLSKPDELDYDVKLKLVNKAVNKILDRLATIDKNHLPYEDAEEIVNKEFAEKCGSNDRQYLRRLISEGVLNEDLYWNDRKDYYGIHFTYQRFQDHLTVSNLLDKYLDPKAPNKSFGKGKLHNLLKDQDSLRRNQNLIEALAIQVPERVGKELHEVAPYIYKYYSTAYGFIYSLIWRKQDTITSQSLDYVNNVIGRDKELFFRFLDVTLSCALKPGFYFNAERLHKTLLQLTITERDSCWTTWLQDKYGENSGSNSVKRLIDWAWNEENKDEVSDDAIQLGAISLGWFLTSSNRYLRDGATKGLICLLQDRIPVLIQVLSVFEKVNDPYVQERLYAVAYGCALRTKDQKSLVPLSELIYSKVFRTGIVYPHILLRDYARGVIEYTLHLGLKPKVKVEKIKPPYNSTLPKSFPTDGEIEKKYAPKEKEGNHGGKMWGTTAIFTSMEMGSSYGDFGRYVFSRAISDFVVDVKGIHNYAIQRIFELGYKPEIFTEFDSKQGSGRGAGHKERIGKKYQWIAFYEMLARVSDNCKLIDESSWQQKQTIPFEGSWNPYIRDIDPSLVIRNTQKREYGEEIKKQPWWFPVRYDQWNIDKEKWIKDDKDLPAVTNLLIVKDNHGAEWVNLYSNADWNEPRKPGEDRYKGNHKRVSYYIRSWLIKPADLNKMLKINLTVEVGRNWTPDPASRYEVFSREYFWSPAWSFFTLSRYQSGDALGYELEHPTTKKKIGVALHTASYFLWEEEFDCSKDHAITFIKPAAMTSAGLTFARKEGSLLNDKGEIVCIDPSVYEKGPSTLLMRKDHLLNLLKETGLKVVWIIQGRKQILGQGKDLAQASHDNCGIYHLDSTGTLKGTTKSFIVDYGQE